MRVSYYPGCSLEATASDYEASIEAVTKLLDIELSEIEDWNCCGASAAHSLDHELAIQLSARNLSRAEGVGLDVVVPCALCFNRLKSAEKELLAGHASDYSFSGKIQVKDLLEFLSSAEVLSKFQEKIVKPLQGLKAVCYYGCQANRPPKVVDRKDHENPMDMDRVVKACGAEAIDWPLKTDCCGASHAVARPDLIDELVGRLYDMAVGVGADCLVVSCQMCQANVDMYQGRIGQVRGKPYDLPVFYFTELMGLAADLPDAAKWLQRHFVDPVPLLKKLELL